MPFTATKLVPTGPFTTGAGTPGPDAQNLAAAVSELQAAGLALTSEIPAGAQAAADAAAVAAAGAQAAVDSLTPIVGDKADQGDLNALSARVDALTTTPTTTTPTTIDGGNAGTVYA